MSIFDCLLERSAEFKQIISNAEGGKLPMIISGAADAQKAHLINSICKKMGKRALVITHNDIQARRLCDDLSFFSENECVYIPPKEVLLFEVEASNHEAENKRAAALGALAGGANAVLSVESLLHFVLHKEKLCDLSITFSYGGAVDAVSLPEKLTEMGYTRTDTVNIPGQFAIRGGIVDIYSPDGLYPIRMELFGDDIDSLRIFDCETQISVEKIETAKIIPVNVKCERETVLSYAGEGYIIFADEPQKMSESAKATEWEISENIEALAEKGIKNELYEYINSYSEIAAEIGKRPCISLSAIGSICPDWQIKSECEITVKGMSSYSGNIEFLVSDVKRWQDEGVRTVILAGSTSRAKRISEMLCDHDIRAVYEENPTALSENYVTVVKGSITRGFEYPIEKYALVSDSEIFAAEKKKRRSTKTENTVKIRSTDQLEVGDYVVHRVHGIGKYLGIVRMKVTGVTKDYIKIEYRGEDYLFLPVGQLDAVNKYMGGENKIMRLNRLGSNEWANSKRRVKESVQEMAQKLVALYAERAKLQGVAFSEDTPWQHDFESAFPYEETEDQLRSTREMKKDMESPRPMDRLLCGDVGYGKTEVAMRGAFKAVMDGYQVAYLVPTTILASQHYQNFVKRMSDFPITIRMLSRFSTPTQTKKTLKMLQSGECDIVVGTHKLLSKNVVFKKLGFLIIDEEQRFGVTHKEKIKEMKKNVDVLTLSATPIPRTLHMAMIGIRDMSVLAAPPSDRYPVQTYVLEYNEAVVKNAIERELSRGGQVYYLHNRVESIYSAAERIKKLVPDARVEVAHGKMNESELDAAMMKLIDGEVDVLVCTTIIETGIDVQNVNTIIIENSDTLGLSQLYQLRGRVGRTNRLAYAYFTYKKNKTLDEVAEKRLRAIREFTEFGSGFRIAMRDLEIRGAGNVLGPEQHGFMASVGYDMYCTILEETVNEAMGKPKKEEKVETVIDLEINAFIPDSYIPTSKLRIEAYKQIAGIEDIHDRYDVEAGFEDRYGEIPKETYTLLDIQLMRKKAQEIGIREISHVETGIIFKISALTRELVEKISVLATKNKGKILFGAGENPYILLREKNLKGDKLLESVNNVLKLLQNEAE